jgi:hypothetical protein
MNLEKIIQSLNLTILTETKDFASIPVENGYCSDLLSCVMTGAQPNGIWVTLMAHGNIVAVAALLDLAAVIITEDAQPDENTLQQANQRDVILLSSPKPNYQIVGELWDLGLKST